MRDVPLRTKLLVAIISVASVGGILTLLAGGFLLNAQVIQEANRRVELALKTARSALDTRLAGTRTSCSLLADELGATNGGSELALPPEGLLEGLRDKAEFDYLHLIDARGIVRATARGNATGQSDASPLVQAALKEGRAVDGFRIVPASFLATESQELAAKAHVQVIPTPRAKGDRPVDLRETMVLEAASPIVVPPGRVIGVVRAGTAVNRNSDMVDRIRNAVFTISTYKGKSLGTVTIFQDDVRVATNVTSPDGSRAIGTRVSAEVYDQVLRDGRTWLGPAFVVGNWYVSAYEPIRDVQGRIVGMLYAGVLKDRYDDALRDAMSLLLAIVILVTTVGVVMSFWLSSRIAGPVVGLTQAAVRVARGELECRLPEPASAQRDEIRQLVLAFNQMVTALQQRDGQLRETLEDLRSTSDELRRWNQNYLDTLEFITHELKNQVAAMKVNLLAVRDGYVGELAEEQYEALDDVSTAINRTEEMILNYLNLSRIEKGELEVRSQPVAISSDILRPVLRELKGQFEEKRMTVEVNVPDDMVVQADPALLQIVYENLLSNAAKYGRQGGTVRMSGRRINGWVELHTWNEGQGVSDERIDELFRKFSRLQPPGHQERGTGLGLYITREIVRKHGGEVRAESREGEWIDFIFTLPRHDMLLEEFPEDVADTAEALQTTLIQ